MWVFHAVDADLASWVSRSPPRVITSEPGCVWTSAPCERFSSGGTENRNKKEEKNLSCGSISSRTALVPMMAPSSSTFPNHSTPCTELHNATRKAALVSYSRLRWLGCTVHQATEAGDTEGVV